MFSGQKNKRKDQRAVCVHGMQLNLGKSFALLLPTDSALNNRLLLQSVLLNRVAEVRGTERWRTYWEL